MIYASLVLTLYVTGLSGAALFIFLFAVTKHTPWRVIPTLLSLGWPVIVFVTYLRNLVIVIARTPDYTPDAWTFTVVSGVVLMMVVDVMIWVMLGALLLYRVRDDDGDPF